MKSTSNEDIVKFGKKLRIDLPKNLGDLIYSFRYRAAFPKSIQSKAPNGQRSLGSRNWHCF
ncbi:MAG: hypothetical protein DMF72_13615 [Acidobacteria bacterium]|nr:MAG: hypothetical protein DMF72_13615 [Acidobacteriota bacterium]